MCVEWKLFTSRCEVFNLQKSFTRSKTVTVDCIATHNNRISVCVCLSPLCALHVCIFCVYPVHGMVGDVLLVAMFLSFISVSFSLFLYLPSSDCRELRVHPEELVIPSGCRDFSQPAGGVGGVGRLVM